MDKLCLEKNFCALSEKELFYCSLDKQDFYSDIDNELIYDNIDDNVIGQIDTRSVVLFSNMSSLEKILDAERRNDVYVGNLRDKRDGIPVWPLYLYYDEKQFVKLAQSNDLSGLCSIYRIVILVGMKEFEDFFCQPDVIYPTVIYGDTENNLSLILSEIKKEREIIFGDILQELKVYYKKNSDEIKSRILNGNARICILKNYFEPTRFKEFYMQFKNVLDQKGYKVEICDERGPIFRTHEIINVYQYRPDIVFQINKSRTGGSFLGESIQLQSIEDLIFINWLQDIYPEAWDKQYASSLKKNDFVFSFFDEHILKEYNYPSQNVIYKGFMPACSEDFAVHPITEEEHKRYDYDLCFFGTLMNEQYVTQWIFTELGPYLKAEKINRVCEVILNMLEGIYDANTQHYITARETLERYSDQLQEEFQCNNTVRTAIYRVFDSLEYNTLRKLILKQLASQKKYKIVLYGPMDVNIEGVDFGGYIADRKELSKAIQCSKLLVQIVPHGTMNQRICEGLLSHTMVMVYKMNDIDNRADLSQYLNEYEGICYFRDKKELIEKCNFFLENDDIREKIAERGYQKAKEKLTTDYAFSYLMDEMKKRI